MSDPQTRDDLLAALLAQLGERSRGGAPIDFEAVTREYPELAGELRGLWATAGVIDGLKLGDDLESLAIEDAAPSARIDLPRRMTVYPWFEWAQPSSDFYDQIDYGPILLRKTGYQERRYRIGARARFWLRYGFRIEPRALYEHIDTYAFVPGATRNNGGAAVDIFWSKPAR